MKVSLRATYGIIAAVDLAHDTESTGLRKVYRPPAGDSARFLEQVLHAMKKQGWSRVSEAHRAAGGSKSI
ncbi:MAG: hypothetical protein U0361_12100 [Nitrospiraceae bacterium]